MGIVQKNLQRELKDSFGRSFQYLRLSVTDVCNFRCVYCLPNGYQKGHHAEAPLTPSEIGNLVGAFSELGVWKIRLTGGEPTVRKDILEVAQAVAQVPGVRKVALSTNGYRLRELAPSLKTAGIDALNVSIDSLDPVRFQRITGQDRLDEVLTGVRTAVDAGIPEIKVNAVLMKGLNDEDVELFLKWAKEAPISIRFIELMKTGQNDELFGRHHLSMGALQFRLFRDGWKIKARGEGDGPAVEFVHSDYAGRIGLIAPYSDDFCKSCNRLRVSSQGAMRLCLFGESDYSLRPLLQSESQRGELVVTLENLIYRKPVAHYLNEGKYGNTWNLSSIGG